jgi:hypothetical protein
LKSWIRGQAKDLTACQTSGRESGEIQAQTSRRGGRRRHHRAVGPTGLRNPTCNKAQEQPCTLVWKVDLSASRPGGGKTSPALL